MKRLLTKIGLIGGLTLALGGPAFGMSMRHVMHHRATGTIATISSHEITINKTVRGTAQELNIALNPNTKRIGTLTPGDRVSVRYFRKHNERVATSVRDLSR